MQELKDLIFIVNKRRLSKIENLDKTLISNKDTLFSRFYQGLYEGKYENDDDVAKDLYGTDKSDYRYRQLKHRFRKRLLNTLYFLNINSDENLSAQDKSYYECLSRIHICNIVQKYGGLRSTTVSLIKDVYPIAEKNMFLEALVEYSYKLAIHYSLTGEEKKFNIEINKYFSYTNQLNTIRRSVIIYYEVGLLLYKNAYLNKTHEKILLDKIEQLNEIYQSCKVLTTYYNLIWIKLIYFDYTGKNIELLNTCHLFLKNYKNHLPTGNTSIYVTSIQIYFLKALLLNRKYDEASSYIKQYKHKVRGSNWFLMSEYELKNYINNNHLDDAKLLINSIKKHPQYKATNKLDKERWQIYSIYQELIVAYNKEELPNLKIAKLENELQETLKDKAGFNLALRILRIIGLLSKNKWTDFIGELESLNTYFNRHLNAKPFVRAKLFLKLIFYLEKINDINYNSLLKLKEYNELKNNFSVHILHESEIINYDKLWEVIVYIINYNKK